MFHALSAVRHGAAIRYYIEGLRQSGKKWYIDMSMMNSDDSNPIAPHSEEEIPSGIARLRREWREAGLPDHAILIR